LNVVVVNVV